MDGCLVKGLFIKCDFRSPPRNSNGSNIELLRTHFKYIKIIGNALTTNFLGSSDKVIYLSVTSLNNLHIKFRVYWPNLYFFEIVDCGNLAENLILNIGLKNVRILRIQKNPISNFNFLGKKIAKA